MTCADTCSAFAGGPPGTYGLSHILAPPHCVRMGRAVCLSPTQLCVLSLVWPGSLWCFVSCHSCCVGVGYGGMV